VRPVFVVSDLHLGDGGTRDNFHFGDRRASFEAFLDHVEAQAGRLVILGDLFEFWQGNLGQILVSNRPLLDRLARMGAEYVVGNHDMDLGPLVGHDFLAHPFFARMRGAFDRRFVIGGRERKVRFMHGHETDPVNNSLYPGLGQVCSILAGMLEDLNGSPVGTGGEALEPRLEQTAERLLVRAEKWGIRLVNGLARLFPRTGRTLTPAQNPSRLKAHVEQMGACLREGGYDLIVCGHTHQAGLYPDAAAPWYVNVGGWVAVSQASPVNTFARFTDAAFGVFRWTESGPEAWTQVLEP